MFSWEDKAIAALSLTSGWVIILFPILGVLGLLWLLIGPPKHLKWAVPIALIGSALVILGAKFYTENILNLWGEPLRWRVYIFAALALAALALIAPRLIRSKHWYTRLLTPIAAVLVVLAAGLQINQVFGYYPTVGSLWGDNGVHVQGLLPSDTVDKSKLTPTTPTVREQSWHPPAGMPSAGKFVSVRIPATVSKVHSGVSYVYIPPAYRVQNPANVPVLVLIHGNPGGALDWQRGGRITQQMNTYAAEHHGIAPLVVMPDVTSGNSGTWSLCMDSKRAKGATFLGVDVPNYVKKTFGLGLAGGSNLLSAGSLMAVPAPCNWRFPSPRSIQRSSTSPESGALTSMVGTARLSANTSMVTLPHLPRPILWKYLRLQSSRTPPASYWSAPRTSIARKAKRSIERSKMPELK